MNSLLLWWYILELKTKIYAILIFGSLIGSIGARGVFVFNEIVFETDSSPCLLSEGEKR
ncbi:hypothetical protein [Leptospira yasudae]|uniref:hypothetical protein n=1 Tax=Leptospira yasudae TaxID=2202201 RepID=UPI00142DE7DF|nr:hypothetical protein [Leptospira yasudae]